MAADFSHLDPPQVLVAGAGFSGLAAAFALHKQGLRALVVEARRRPGGRVWSRELPNGAVAEMGGEWISPQDFKLMALAEELGLQLAPIGVNFFARRTAGAHVSTAQLEAAGRRTGEALAALAPESAGAMSLGGFLDGLGLAEPVRSVLRARLQGSAGAPLEQIALASYAGDHFGFYGEGPFYRLAGGNQSLAAAIEAQIPAIIYGQSLAAVEQDEGSVRLICHGTHGTSVFEAACAILALPLPVARSLEYRPGLPGGTAEALRRTPMGTAAKLARATRKRPALDAHQDLEVPFWSWTGLGGHGGVRPVVSAFCGSQPALERLEIEGSDPRAWSAKLQAAHPEVAFEGDPLLADWSADPLAGGCYSAFDPLSWALREALQQPHGRVHFAGEHTSANFGTMEGALESGLRAAASIMELAGAGGLAQAEGRT